MKILITGGCGFLGSNLAAHAIKNGHKVGVVDNLYRKGSELNHNWLNEQGKFDFWKTDVREPQKIEAVMQKFCPDAVFHLAGQVAMTTSIENPRFDFEVNALGSLNVLEAVRKTAPEASVVYSSTNKVYGDLEQFTYKETATRYECVEKPGGFDETVALEFHSPYGCSKGSADQYFQDYARIYGLKTVVFRHSSMYGGRQFATYDQGWIGWFCQKALEQKAGNREEFTISGTGKQVRDVLHAEDMISLYFSALKNIDGMKGQVFNVGGGVRNSLSLIELFELLGELTAVPLKYRRIEPRSSDQKVFIADIAKISEAANWNPAVTAREGVGKMLKWLGTSKKR